MSEFLRRWKSLLLLGMEAQDAAAAAASEVPKGHSSSVLVQGVVELLRH